MLLFPLLSTCIVADLTVTRYGISSTVLKFQHVPANNAISKVLCQNLNDIAKKHSCQ